MELGSSVVKLTFLLHTERLQRRRKGELGVDSARAQEDDGGDKSLGFVEEKEASQRIMAAGDPSLPQEEQCPQLSTTVSSPVVDEDIPGLSGEVTRVRRAVSRWPLGEGA